MNEPMPSHDKLLLKTNQKRRRVRFVSVCVLHHQREREKRTTARKKFFSLTTESSKQRHSERYSSFSLFLTSNVGLTHGHTNKHQNTNAHADHKLKRERTTWKPMEIERGRETDSNAGKKFFLNEIQAAECLYEIQPNVAERVPYDVRVR